MADLGNFNANDVPPMGDFSPLPEGKYEAMIVESETIQNANGNGSHLKLTLVVTRGEYEGRNLWHRLNLENPSEKAVQIARGQLSAICRAVGVLTPKDSADLHSLPMIVAVKQEQYDGGVSNKITSFAARNGAAPSAIAPVPSKAPTTAPWGARK
jgi:hypothetical protein